MKRVDSRVISESFEFIFNLLNVVVTKHFFAYSYETVKFILNTLYIHMWYPFFSQTYKIFSISLPKVVAIQAVVVVVRLPQVPEDVIMKR